MELNSKSVIYAQMDSVETSAHASPIVLMDNRLCEFSDINKAFFRTISGLAFSLSLTKKETIPQPDISDSVLVAFCTLLEICRQD